MLEKANLIPNAPKFLVKKKGWPVADGGAVTEQVEELTGEQILADPHQASRLAERALAAATLRFQHSAGGSGVARSGQPDGRAGRGHSAEEGAPGEAGVVIGRRRARFVHVRIVHAGHGMEGR